MNPGKLSYYSRKIHRISLWFVTISGLIQMVTGLAQKFPAFLFTDIATIIKIHTLNSLPFVIALLVSMITGLIMYITPLIIKALYKQSRPTNLPN